MMLTYLQIYTLKIYSRFESEFMKSYATILEHSLRTFEGTRFKITSQSQPEDVGIVLFNNEDQSGMTIRCTCKRFEEVGWLCFHSIRVLLHHNIQLVPDAYILPRWTRTVKVHVWDKVKTKAAIHPDNLECPGWRGHMSRSFVNLIITAEGDIESRKLLEDTLHASQVAINQLIHKTGSTAQPTQDEAPADAPVVRDPPHTKTKGRSKKRIKGKFERSNTAAPPQPLAIRNKHII